MSVWFYSYAYRRRNESNWRYFNEVTRRHPLLMHGRWDQYRDREEYRILSYHNLDDDMEKDKELSDYINAALKNGGEF